MINSQIREPDPPGDWVDDEECTVCGERYAEYREFTSSSAAWDAGRVSVRMANPDGAYLSHGPVLWAARVQKLYGWYQRHSMCGGYRDNPAQEHPFPIVGNGARWVVIVGIGGRVVQSETFKREADAERWVRTLPAGAAMICRLCSTWA